ncbi:hypothetical protein QYE76_022410 [Lolium multiflorum]|uniref:WRKY domain-containing protein n=1 Tax=Lolium multiflorum TaxID=4521 RepID=A0AAD8VU36_LOLMU|nr:hypothetical protein QYE76_022410 [Lolium multiflorum]
MEEEHCANNWDLHAVVRFGCRRAMSPPTPRRHDPFATFLPPPPVKDQPVDAGWCFPDLGAGFGQDADELLKAFCAPPSPPQLPLPHPPQQLPVSPPPLQPPKQQQQQAMMAPAEVPLQTAAAAPAPRAQPSGRQASGGVPRSKRRKNQQKKVVCHVAADGVSSDVWAWRKYGQKPIKGSPYPRGYYRCSTAKGCPARKQLERSRADPNTFILTFTGEHNHAAPTHRNSLAGTSRHKFPATSSSSSSARPRPPPPSVVAAGEAQTSTSAGLSPTTPLRASSSSEDEDELLVEDMEMAGEDDLLFLSGDSDNAATPLSSLFDVDEPFLGSAWTEMATGAAGAAGS